MEFYQLQVVQYSLRRNYSGKVACPVIIRWHIWAYFHLQHDMIIPHLDSVLHSWIQLHSRTEIYRFDLLWSVNNSVHYITSYKFLIIAASNCQWFETDILPIYITFSLWYFRFLKFTFYRVFNNIQIINVDEWNSTNFSWVERWNIPFHEAWLSWIEQVLSFNKVNICTIEQINTCLNLGAAWWAFNSELSENWLRCIARILSKGERIQLFDHWKSDMEEWSKRWG